MLAMILTAFLQPDLEKPAPTQLFQPKETPPKILPYAKLPAVMMVRTVAKAKEGHKGWVRKSEIVCTDDGTIYLLKSAAGKPVTMSLFQTPDQHVFVACGANGEWSMHLWSFMTWEPVDAVPTDAVEVKGVYLRFQEIK